MWRTECRNRGMSGCSGQLLDLREQRFKKPPASRYVVLPLTRVIGVLQIGGCVLESLRQGDVGVVQRFRCLLGQARQVKQRRLPPLKVVPRSKQWRADPPSVLVHVRRVCGMCGCSAPKVLG